MTSGLFSRILFLLRLEEVYHYYYHITQEYEVPPGAGFEMLIGPPKGWVWIIYTSFGDAYDKETGATVRSFNFGFWHKGPNMLWHYDPAESSLMNFEYPHVDIVPPGEVYRIRFINDEDKTIIFDITCHIIEIPEEEWERAKQILKKFITGGGR